jgi:hypothetical protein
MWTSEVHINEAVVLITASSWTGLGIGFSNHADLANLRECESFHGFPFEASRIRPVWRVSIFNSAYPRAL